MGSSWGVLGCLRQSWRVLDVSGVSFGCILERRGASWRCLGASSPGFILGVSFGRLESVLGRLEAYNPHALESRLGSHNQPSTALNGTLRYASVMPIKNQLLGCFAGIVLEL